MPQLEMGDYAPQIFWLVVTFVALMLIMWSVGLPRIRRVIEARAGKIGGDLAEAESMKGRAEDALKAYEEALAEARSRAHGVLAETQAKLAAEADALRVPSSTRTSPPGGRKRRRASRRPAPRRSPTCATWPARWRAPPPRGWSAPLPPKPPPARRWTRAWPRGAEP